MRERHRQLDVLRGSTGPRKTNGLTDDLVVQFYDSDPTLRRAIEEAGEVFAELEKEYGAELRLPETDLIERPDWHEYGSVEILGTHEDARFWERQQEMHRQVHREFGNAKEVVEEKEDRKLRKRREKRARKEKYKREKPVRERKAKARDYRTFRHRHDKYDDDSASDEAGSDSDSESDSDVSSSDASSSEESEAESVTSEGRRIQRNRRKQKEKKKREKKERKKNAKRRLGSTKNKRDERRRDRREHWVEVDSKRFRRHARPFVVRARDCEEERVMESYGASCVCSRRWGEEWAPRPADRGLKDFERSMARCMAERGF